MKKIMTIMTALGMLLALTMTSFAYDFGSKNRLRGARQREHEQQQRIRQGIRSGELTKGEARSLEQEQRHINQDIRDARQDGVVTKFERRDIQQDQNRASHDIYRKKHNERVRH